MARVRWAPATIRDYDRLLGKKVYLTSNQKEVLARAQQRATLEAAKIIKSAWYRSLPDNEAEAEPGQVTKQQALQKVFETSMRQARGSFKADLYARLRRREYTPGRPEERART
jgi:hypothetical protein